MRPITILLLFISLTIITSCEKDDGNLKIKVELVGSEPFELIGPESFEIVNSEFEVQVYGYDPNYQDVAATLITRQTFHSTEIPSILNIEIPANAADKIEFIHDEKYARYYINIDWDSDGNGKICNGDLSIDYDAMFPNIFINKTETQTIIMKTIDSTTCD